MPTQATNQPFRAKWDTEASTYFWLIHLDPRNPQNNPRVTSITGYSKQRHQNEAQDKEYLLKRKICMLQQRGYFKVSKQIEFYHNNTGIIDKRHAPLLLICRPQEYVIPPEQHETMYKIFGKWLEDFYKLVRSGQGVDSIMPAVRTSKRVDRDHFINPANYNFKNVGQLYTHAAKLHNYGHAPGAVDSFIQKVKLQNGW